MNTVSLFAFPSRGIVLHLCPCPSSTLNLLEPSSPLLCIINLAAPDTPRMLLTKATGPDGDKPTESQRAQL
jgi:hypothetical protein